MTAALPMVFDGDSAILPAVIGFYVALWLAIDWCFWPRTQASLRRRQARRDRKASR